MRRIASSLIAAFAIATLAACSAGGYGLGTSSSTVPQSAQFSGGSGEVSDYIVSPSGTAPIQITATGYTGSGTTAEVVPFSTFTWQGGYAPAGTVFYKGPSPNGNTACGTPSERPAVPILQQGPGGAPFAPYAGQYSILPPAHTANTIFVGVPIDPTTGLPVQPATGSTNYCLVADAVNANGVVVGGVTIAVTNTAP